MEIDTNQFRTEDRIDIKTIFKMSSIKKHFFPKIHIDKKYFFNAIKKNVIIIKPLKMDTRTQ